jgi:two-component system KDP operon response regulator KdpE
VSRRRILVVDDEPQILHALRSLLQGAGYDVQTAAVAEQALVLAAAHPPDAVILDLVLPDASGVDVCAKLRSWTHVPIVILSAVGEERMKVAALDAGADDYVTKPFGVEEILARLRAVLRRVTSAGSPVIEVAGLRLDLERQALTRDGSPVQLTPHELRLVQLFMENVGKLLTHKTILSTVWGPAYQTESHYLHVYVSQLRRKLEEEPTRPRYLLTEPRAGYRFVDPDERAQP